MDHLAQHIESLIFTAESPIAFQEIKGCLEESFDTTLENEELEKAIEKLIEKYQQDHFAFELLEIAGGFQFLTKAAFHNTVGIYLKQTTKKRLSRAALETLSIIAYKQPVSKGEMEKIRGVSCDYSVQKLLEKELITMTGRSEGPGHPLLYGTSEKFMDYFGLKSLDDLPKPKDFREPDNEIGEKAPIDENAVSHKEDLPEQDIFEEELPEELTEIFAKESDVEEGIIDDFSKEEQTDATSIVSKESIVDIPNPDIPPSASIEISEIKDE